MKWDVRTAHHGWDVWGLADQSSRFHLLEIMKKSLDVPVTAAGFYLEWL